jgi:biopolymer transport protein ExbD
MNLRGPVEGRPEINFIPLIDVLLVILIFLMVTTTYQRVAELQITLPEAAADPMQQRPKEINVGVDAQGRYVIDKNVFQFTTVAALADALKRAAGDARAGGHHQRGRECDTPVGYSRDGSCADGRAHPHHLRDDADEMTHPSKSGPAQTGAIGCVIGQCAARGPGSKVLRLRADELGSRPRDDDRCVIPGERERDPGSSAV